MVRCMGTATAMNRMHVDDKQKIIETSNAHALEDMRRGENAFAQFFHWNGHIYTINI